MRAVLVAKLFTGWLAKQTEKLTQNAPKLQLNTHQLVQLYKACGAGMYGCLSADLHTILQDILLDLWVL